MPYGYIDPVQRVHQQQALRNLARPQPPYVQPTVQPIEPVHSPLDLSNVPAIMYGNGNTTPRYVNPRQGALAGAVVGAAIGLWVAHNKKSRGQSTTPGFRAIMVFLAVLILGVILAASTHLGFLAALGFLGGSAASVGYYHHTPKRSPSVQELQDSQRTGHVDRSDAETSNQMDELRADPALARQELAAAQAQAAGVEVRRNHGPMSGQPTD